MAARIPGPLDVPYTQLRNTRRLVEPAEDDSGNRLKALGGAVVEITNRARDQQIENELASAEMQTRRELDELRVEVMNTPAGKKGEEPDYQGIWDERSRQIVERNTERLRAPLAQRAWRQRMDSVLASERGEIVRLQQARIVEQARAGLITNIATAQTTLVDENATPQARAQAMEVIRTTVERAVQRRVISADDGARTVSAALADLAEFEQTQGMRARAQEGEDRIWTESGGDLTTALEMVRDVEEPGLRDMLEDRITVRASRERAGREMALDEAMGRAYALIEDTGGLDGLAPTDRRLIVARGQMDTLRNYARNRAGGSGEQSWTEMTRQSGLRRDMFETWADDADGGAREFADMDLDAPPPAAVARALGLSADRTIRDQLMPNDFNALRQRQRQMRGEVPLDGNTTIADRSYEMLRDYAEPMAEAQGIEVAERSGGTGARGRENEAVSRRTRQFRAFLRREARDFAERERRTPTQQEIEQITSLALMRSARSGSELRVFEGGVESRGWGGQRRTVVRVPFNSLPRYQVERLTRLWVRANPNGGAPTPQQVEDMYVQELLGQSE